MVDIYCQTDFDGDTRARIEVISSDTPNTSEVVATPPSGKTYQYPVAAHGNFLCYELPAGENVNVHAANANVVVNGTKRLRPVIAPPRFLDFTTTTWGPAGHATILPNDKLVGMMYRRAIEVTTLVPRGVSAPAICPPQGRRTEYVGECSHTPRARGRTVKA